MWWIRLKIFSIAFASTDKIQKSTAYSVGGKVRKDLNVNELMLQGVKENVYHKKLFMGKYMALVIICG